MKYSFPAIFEQDKEDKEFINVTFPDLWGVVTCGKGMEEAKLMAKDVLLNMLQFDYIRETKSKGLEQTKANFPNKTVELVEVEYNG